MSDLPASHYVRIYERRVRSAESRGVSGKALNQMRALLYSLQKTKPDTPVRLEQLKGKVVFVDARSDQPVGELEYLDYTP